MRIGKVKESVLKRSVLRQLHNTKKSRSRDQAEEIFLQINPVEGWALAPERSVYGALNACAAAAVHPEALAVTILMPEGTEEAQLKALMRRMDQVCQEEGIRITAGHTAVSPAVHTLLLSVAVTGLVHSQPDNIDESNNIDVRDASPYGSDIRSGDVVQLKNRDLVMVGTAGREGAAILALQKENDLLSRYSASYIETAKHLYDHAGLTQAAALAREDGAIRLHDVREGGVFGALWELAAASKVGLDIDLKAIPIRQHTIEVCEYFDLNPYMLLSGGCLLAICPDGRAAVTRLAGEGYEAAVIGRTTDGNDRIIRYDTETRYLEPPKADEIYKIRDLLEENE